MSIPLMIGNLFETVLFLTALVNISDAMAVPRVSGGSPGPAATLMNTSDSSSPRPPSERPTPPPPSQQQQQPPPQQNIHLSIHTQNVSVNTNSQRPAHQLQQRPPLPRMGSVGYESPDEFEPPCYNPAPGQGGYHSCYSRNRGPGYGNGASTSTATVYTHAQHLEFSAPDSLEGMMSRAGRAGNVKYGNGKVGIRDRICCVQWNWFTMTMATGGIANVLHSIPYESRWLTGIGLFFYFLNICLFIMNCVLITLRFHWRPGSFVESFTDQMESLFISAIIVSMATIIITTAQYGVPHLGDWLLSVLEALFWVYLVLSTVSSAGLYLTLWSTQVFPIHTMTPVWVFPAYPLLLTAPMAANLISSASLSNRITLLNPIAISLASLTTQGTGFLIAFMISASFLYRLMTQKLPRDHQRPGVFISIGPSGFTAAGLVSLGGLAPQIFPSKHPLSAEILQVLSYMTGLWLWGLSVWFFLVSVGSLWKYLRPEKKEGFKFQMTWFSFVFPNTALVTATEAIGIQLGSEGLKIFGCVLAGG
ncbi:voltage-dependent anion channel-domain-containing protein [Apiosordaria backusii]|uniref:Voltage-dependent anion channel-domain-containing protein n=1 Tax=Apiosordaria backusii TaxID=314023 RepID=A0AA40EXY3_9PEZI|nr:voltage-dependent anion channel-domain-containing protein [Apiosordaria backusii]